MYLPLTPLKVFFCLFVCFFFKGFELSQTSLSNLIVPLLSLVVCVSACVVAVYTFYQGTEYDKFQQVHQKAENETSLPFKYWLDNYEERTSLSCPQKA